MAELANEADDIATQEHKERARKAYERMKTLAHGMSAAVASRTAQRLSKWANPTYLQWRDINREITRDMVKAIWPCDDTEIKKGRWKLAKCLNDDIKHNAERIFLEVYGHPLHNADSPLYFAKMLYVQFVQGRQVDFASKEAIVNTHDIREESVTFTREELSLAMEGAQLELTRIKDDLNKKLQEKEMEATRIHQIASTPPPSQARLEASLTLLRHDVQGISQRINPATRQGNHITHFVQHPEVISSDIAAAGSSNACPVCLRLFDNWSGHYMLSCGHFYHLVCLLRHMQAQTSCTLCQREIPEGLYMLFGMPGDYKLRRQREATPSAIRNLFCEEQGETEINRQTPPPPPGP